MNAKRILAVAEEYGLIPPIPVPFDDVSFVACVQELINESRNPVKYRMSKQCVEQLELMAEYQHLTKWFRIKAGGHMFAGDLQIRTHERCSAVVHTCLMFGLVEHDGHHMSGMYRLSPKGHKFLAGDIEVPEVYLCKKGVVVNSSGSPVSVHEIRHVNHDYKYWQEKYSHKEWAYL